MVYTAPTKPYNWKNEKNMTECHSEKVNMMFVTLMNDDAVKDIPNDHERTIGIDMDNHDDIYISPDMLFNEPLASVVLIDAKIHGYSMVDHKDKTFVQISLFENRIKNAEIDDDIKLHMTSRLCSLRKWSKDIIEHHKTRVLN